MIQPGQLYTSNALTSAHVLAVLCMHSTNATQLTTDMLNTVLVRWASYKLSKIVKSVNLTSEG